MLQDLEQATRPRRARDPFAPPELPVRPGVQVFSVDGMPRVPSRDLMQREGEPVAVNRQPMPVTATPPVRQLADSQPTAPAAPAVSAPQPRHYADPVYDHAMGPIKVRDLFPKPIPGTEPIEFAGAPPRDPELEPQPIQPPSRTEVSANPPPPMGTPRKGWFGRLKSIGEGILYGAASGGVGGMVAGGVTGATNPRGIERWKHNNIAMPRWRQQRADELKEEGALRQEQESKMRIRNIEFDNQLARENLTDRQAAREQQLQLQQSAAKERRAEQHVLKMALYKQPVELAEVKGSAFEYLAGKVPPDKPSAQRNAQTYVGSDGVLYERNDETGEWLPAKTQGGKPFQVRDPHAAKSPSSNDIRTEAKRRAEARAAKEFPGHKYEEIIGSYASGLYSTIAQQKGIDWQTEQIAKDDPSSAEAKLVEDARTEARKQAEALVRRDYDLRVKQLEDEELQSLSSDYTRRTGLLN